jgi:hypothetical protein
MGDLVRCNECYAVFFDEEITVTHDDESCPRCAASGCLMDMPGGYA